jgi:iron complex outermembrane receptor protein
VAHFKSTPFLKVYALIAITIIWILWPTPLPAQTNTALVAGTVLDQTGQALTNATVTIKNAATGAIRTATTGADGHFRADGVPTGVYLITVSAEGFATSNQSEVEVALGKSDDLSITLAVGTVSQSVEVTATASLAAHAAPSQGTLDARSPASLISPAFLQNFVSPVGDYSDIVQMAPGTFSVGANGPGLGDTKIFFRGFKDGFYNITFDGLPWNDTNDPTHHSWAFFPGEFIGSTLFDRSPGDATVIGPASSGGSINLLSRDLSPDTSIRGTISYGSFNTQLLSADFDSGPFGGKTKRNNLLMNVNHLTSDGYQTYNYQNRYGGDAKYQLRINDRTILTGYTSIMALSANTPNIKGPTRAQVAQFGDNYLLSGNPADANFYKFNWYQIPSDFDYVGINSEVGAGWRIEDKVYTDRYYNHQQYNGNSITTTSGTDKLNSYRKYGNAFSAVHDSRYGTLRTGVWYELAYTDRFQTPTDPRTWIDAAVPNFHEKFITQSAQPYAQYEYNITRRLTFTAGFKFSSYRMHLNQYADNGKTVGDLGGVEFVTHDGNYHAFQPTGDLRYRVKDNWTVYAQYATGNVIPPSNVFDVKNGIVKTTPKPTQTKAFQFGSVLKLNRITVDADAFFIKAQSPYVSAPDPVTGEPVYYLSGNTLSKGFETEVNLAAGHGFNVYLNGTVLSAKYLNSDLWVANAPHDTETMGITYLKRNWDIGFFNKRIGSMYNDSGSFHQNVPIDPFNITNLFFNYTVKQRTWLRGTKLRFGVTNLFDQHNIIAVTPAKAAAVFVPADGDVLSMMAGRSLSITATFGYSPER